MLALSTGLLGAVARTQPAAAPPAQPAPAQKPAPAAAAPAPPEPQPAAAPDTGGNPEEPQSSTELGFEVEDSDEPEASRLSTAESLGAQTRVSAEVAVRYTLENIEIRGVSRTHPRVVLRYVPFKPGDVIDVDDPEVELTRYRLLGTGFFRDVQFSLRKGSRRGLVVLVIDVEERNTIIINDLWMGLSKDADRNGVAKPLTAYLGLDAADTNLAGTGITLGGAVAVATDQLALRVRFLDPAVLGSHWMMGGTLLFNDAKDFFGNANVQYYPGQLRGVPAYAVVEYTRLGGSLGIGRDLSVATQAWFHYRLESIDASVPFASHLRGGVTEPIEFDIIPGRSVLSAARVTVQHDTRDQPFLPTRGWFVSLTGEVTVPFSDYSYQRVDVDASRWWKLPWKQHVLRLQMFGGAIAGDAPFFEQYYVNDFTDFRPGRVLGLNFDRRPPPDFFHTAIIEVRRGEYAAKLGLEYRIPLYRGARSVYGIDLFLSSGLYAVAGRRDINRPPRGFSGVQRVPFDFTANLGFRMDTSAGGFVFAFANTIGLLPPVGGRSEQ